VRDPDKAAAGAIAAIKRLKNTQNSQRDPSELPSKGVAKLGWSWEAKDVWHWDSPAQLRQALMHLAGQSACLADSVFVQEWVDADVEMRHFVVEPSIDNPSTWKPKHTAFTTWKSLEFNGFHVFEKFDRNTCLRTCFHDDAAALDDAERQAEELIANWLQWFQAQSHEMPVFIRFDVLAKRIGAGRAAVRTIELTELGGCIMNWADGPDVVFDAVLRACLQEEASP